MQAMGLKAKRHRTEVGQTEPDGAQTQNFYPCAGRFKRYVHISITDSLSVLGRPEAERLGL